MDCRPAAAEYERVRGTERKGHQRMRDFDSIELEILWQRLISVLNEVDQIIVRTTFSTILSEGRDFACILTDRNGASLCQSVWSSPSFCVVLPRTARVLLEHFPTHTLQPGDVLATNDPWQGTGHLPDYILLIPVFREGEVIAYIGTVSHMSDVGGHPNEIEGSDVFAEGLRMTPFKLYEGGAENELAFSLIGANCRVPDLLLGDLRAMAGAAKIGSRRIADFLFDYDLNNLDCLARAILDRSEAHMRAQIRALPDGRYEHDLEIDGYLERISLRTQVVICGDEIEVRFRGTSPQTDRAAINASYNTTYATVVFPFKCALAPYVPNNEGLFRPIEVNPPDNSILNARFPAPVKARAKTTNNLNQCIFGALHSILGEQVQASNGSIWPFVLSGSETGYGNYLVDMLPHGGRGGQPTLDGMLPVAWPNNSTITPCEVMETRAPLRFHAKELWTDSAGPGMHRGGLGQVIAFEHVGREAMMFNLTPDRVTTVPPGLAGGEPGVMGEVFINQERVNRFPPILLQPGDVVELRISGGGGFGPAEQRSSELVAQDVARGYLTLEKARSQYGLSLSPISGKEVR